MAGEAFIAMRGHARILRVAHGFGHRLMKAEAFPLAAGCGTPLGGRNLAGFDTGQDQKQTHRIATSSVRSATNCTPVLPTGEQSHGLVRLTGTPVSGIMGAVRQSDLQPDLPVP